MFTGLVLSLAEPEELDGRSFTNILTNTTEENFHHEICVEQRNHNAMNNRFM